MMSRRNRKKDVYKYMNIEWKKIGLEDRGILESYYKYEHNNCCEFCFANNYLWAPIYDTVYAIIKDMLVFRTGSDTISVSMPLAKNVEGEKNLKEVVLILEEYFFQENMQFVMGFVTEEKYALLEELFPGKYRIEYDRNGADYIYEVEKMISLAGKKLHGKRNHINNFKKNYPDWSYEALTKENRKECLEMAEEWKHRNLCEKNGEKHAEFCVTRRAIEYFEELNLKGGILRAGGEIVGFTLGEELNKEMFVVHIEKAFSHVQGAYPMINQQFLIHEAGKYKYVNREDDTGAEGLRKAKLSYYPAFLQEKGTIRIK